MGHTGLWCAILGGHSPLLRGCIPFYPFLPQGHLPSPGPTTDSRLAYALPGMAFYGRCLSIWFYTRDTPGYTP